MTDVATNGLDDQPLARLCADHLHEEETLLRAALDIVTGVEAGLAGRASGAFPSALAVHAQFCQLILEMRARRDRFRQAVAGRLNLPPEKVTITRTLAGLEGPARALSDDAARVSGLADALAAATQKVSARLRVYLDCYRRILRDLTNTATSSGRYGPAGRAESLDYRPLLSIHG
jgi:hypothetical protein